MERKKKRMKRRPLGDRILLGIVTFFAVLNLFPLYWLISNTLKQSWEISKMPPDWFPKTIHFDHYIELFQSTNAAIWTVNSMVVALGGTMLVVLISSLAAYSFSKLPFSGKKVLYPCFIGTLMIPKESYLVPLFSMMSKWNMLNTYSSMILPTLALPFGVFLLKSFFDGIPDAIRESARIDGAHELTIYFRIMLPMASAGIGALFILMFVRFWNDYLWQLLMGQQDVKKTLMVGVASLMEDQRPDVGRRLTGAAIAALPMIIVFLIFQKSFSRGITVGAIKE